MHFPFLKKVKKKTYILITFLLTSFLPFILLNCNKVDVFIPQVFNIKNSKQSTLVSPIYGSGTYPLKYNLIDPKSEDLIVFITNNKIIRDARELDNSFMGIKNCQFFKEYNNITGGACDIDLAKLDSFDSGDDEAYTIQYIIAKNKNSIQQKLQMANPPINRLVVHKGGPHIVLKEGSKFNLISFKQDGGILKHTLAPKNGRKLKNYTTFTLTVNHGNEIDSSLNWEIQKAKLRKEGLKCKLKRGKYGQISCKITNKRKMMNKKSATIFLTTYRLTKSKKHALILSF